MRRLKTGRRPPIYPKTPGHLPCSSLTHPLPLSSRRPSVSFGGFGLTLTVDEFPYPGKANYVFTKGEPPQNTDYVEFVSREIAEFVGSLKEQPGKDIWLVGGGQINTVMLKAGLIDEVILTVFPLVLGEGIQVFAPGATRHSFKTLGCQTFETGLIQWRLVKD